ncbi:MAG: glycosyltransferase family 39 protein, partial [Nanoarchaeota archaeon]|nr:glycosyltransferase family 39 protein [Nanoarchaeota archaeon]
MIYSFLLALLVFYVSLMIGTKILRRFNLDIVLGEKFIFSIALGFAVVAYSVFLLGLMGMIYRAFFMLALIFLGIAFIPEGIRFVRSISFNFKFDFIFIPVVLFLILGLIGALAPPTGWDPQVYHLSAAKEYVQQHRIAKTQFINANLPALADMLIVFGIALQDDITAKLIFYSGFVMLAFSVCILSRRYFSRSCAGLAILIFLSIPLIIYYPSTLHTDMFLSLFIILSIFSFYRYIESHERKWIIISSIFAGISLATKITAIIFLSGFVILHLITLYFREDRKRALKDLLLSGIIILIISAPWFIKTLVFAGNPVYPLA